MITTKNADLFSIAKTGVSASNQLLQTTSHNIANVNSDGYVRERTGFGTQLTGGVGRGYTERVLDQFAQQQLRRDTTQLGEFENYYQRTSALDNIFASQSNSISAAMSRFFAQVQTATDDPTNMAARTQVLGEANSMMGQFGVMAGFLDDKERELNLQMQSHITTANGLIQSIADLNSQIRIAKGSNRFEEPGALMNARDNAVLELAKLISIETRPSGSGDGSVLINMTSGESLVLQDGSFNVFQLGGDPDLTYKKLELASTGKPTVLGVQEANVGGTIGGMFRYREEVLAPAQRELGQIAVALSESFNRQNRLGMDYDGQLGADIFAIGDFQGLNYADNTNPSLVMNGRIAPGAASEITSSDYRITIDAVSGGAPPAVDVTVELVNPDGTPVNDVNGAPIVQSFTGLTAQAGTFNTLMHGLEVEFPAGAAYTGGGANPDQFLLQPTKNIADNISVQMSRPEDLALARPMRVTASLANLGEASVVSTSVTNTLVDNTFSNPDASPFDGAGGIHGPGAAPGGTVGAPAEIRFTASDTYQVLDSAGTVINTVTGASDLTNLLAKAAAAPGWPPAFAALNNYPGYDLSLQGQPVAGDTFTISYNTDGQNDNSNGLAMSALQNDKTMLLNDNDTGNLVSFHEAYAILVSDIGEHTSAAKIAQNAAQALQKQSQDRFDSTSGVSLDEEAANLVKFQQAYSASARILGTAQELFNTILSAVR